MPCAAMAVLRLLVAAALGDVTLGYSSNKAKMPNADNVQRNSQSHPGVGHTARFGSGARNSFGSAFQAAGGAWTIGLCQQDSDGDGQTNGFELGDPDCTWSQGGTPSRTTQISHPGFADSTSSAPVATATETTITATATTVTATETTITATATTVTETATTLTLTTVTDTSSTRTWSGITSTLTDTTTTETSTTRTTKTGTTATLTSTTTSTTSETQTTATETATTDTATTATATVTATSTTSPPVLLKVGQKSSIPLGRTGMTLGFRSVGEDSIELEVAFPGTTWISIGFNPAGTVSMTGGGDGAESIVCSSQGVERYDVIGYELRSPQTMDDASCVQESGTTTLKFVRKLAAEAITPDPDDSLFRRLSAVSVMPGTEQGIVFARGDDSSFALAQHSPANRGGQNIDFASGVVTVAEKRSGEAVLMLHVALMAVAWGGLLPFGAVISNRFRTFKDSWFKWHRGVQTAGWGLQLLGFVMGIVYVQEHSVHFTGLHKIVGLVVVSIGTFHPVNAILRPHNPAQGETKSQARVAWEWIHKGGGWFAIVLGALNCILGILLLKSKDYDGATVGIAAVLTAISIFLPLVAVAYSVALNGRSKKVPNEVTVTS